MKNSGTPFARALQMMTAVFAAMRIESVVEQRCALDAIPGYVSRGKGRGRGDAVRHPKLFGRSKYLPGQCSQAREIARRQRQIARGLLSPVVAA